MSTSYPITNPQLFSLGQLGGGTEAPARVRALGLIAADIGTATPTAAQYSASIWLGASSAPSGLTGQTPGSLFWDATTPSDLYATKADGSTVKWLSDGVLTAPVTTSLFLAGNGTVGAPSFAFTNSATTGLYRSAADTIGIAVAGALDFSIAANTFNVLTGSNVLFADSCPLYIGSGAGGVGDIAWSWDGTRCNVTQLTANSEIRWGVDGAGIDQRWYGDTASAYMLWDQSADARIMGGAAVDVFTQSTTGTGQLVHIYGPDTTHGLARYSYTATVSPSAIETALFTVPANSRIISTSMNIESALTGGGTTVTASIGITGDVDAYGTIGSPTDALTKNSKGIWAGSIAAGAGASLGVFSKSTVALKLIGAATGGAAAGDTALTVGSVKITVIYETLLGLADAP